MYNPGDILYVESKTVDFKCIIILAHIYDVIYAHAYMFYSNNRFSFDFFKPIPIIDANVAHLRYATDDEKRKLNELMVKSKIYFDKKHLALVQNNEI
jgi:hypothetical protein